MGKTRAARTGLAQKMNSMRNAGSRCSRFYLGFFLLPLPKRCGRMRAIQLHASGVHGPRSDRRQVIFSKPRIYVFIQMKKYVDDTWKECWCRDVGVSPRRGCHRCCAWGLQREATSLWRRLSLVIHRVPKNDSELTDAGCEASLESPLTLQRLQCLRWLGVTTPLKFSAYSIHPS